MWQRLAIFIFQKSTASFQLLLRSLSFHYPRRCVHHQGASAGQPQQAVSMANLCMGVPLNHSSCLCSRVCTAGDKRALAWSSIIIASMDKGAAVGAIQ